MSSPSRHFAILPVHHFTTRVEENDRNFDVAKVNKLCALLYSHDISFYLIFWHVLSIWLRVPTWFKGSLGSGNHPLQFRVRVIFVLYPLSTISVFIFVSGVSVFVFASAKKKWKQMWHHSVPSVSAPFSSLYMGIGLRILNYYFTVIEYFSNPH